MKKRRGASKISYILVIAILLVAIILVIALIYFVMKHSKKTDVNDYMTSAQAKDVSECEKLDTPTKVFDCKIDVSSRKKDTSYCLGELPDSKFSSSMRINGTKYSLSLDSRDYCFLKMSVNSKVNYCSSVINTDARNACNAYIAYSNLAK
jgi:hypothetical protein